MESVQDTHVLHWRSTGNSLLVLPGGNAEKNMIIKLPKNILERVQPQTKADSELQPMFAGPAPYFANALLGVGL